MIAIHLTPQNKAAIDALRGHSSGLCLMKDIHRRHFRKDFGPLIDGKPTSEQAVDVKAIEKQVGPLSPTVRRHLQPAPRYIVTSFRGHMTVYLPNCESDFLAARVESMLFDYLFARSLTKGSWKSTRERQSVRIGASNASLLYEAKRISVALEESEWPCAIESSGFLEDLMADAIYAGILNSCLWAGWQPGDLPPPDAITFRPVRYMAEMRPLPMKDGLLKRMVRGVTAESGTAIEGPVFAGRGVQTGTGLLCPIT